MKKLLLYSISMKRALLCFISFFPFSFSLSAQWVSGGTQVSFSPDNHHRPFLSAAANGGFYVTWQSTDTTANEYNKIRTAAYDSNGNLLSGWTSGGTLASPTGDHYASQIITTEDGGAIIAWYGYPLGNPRSSIFVQKYSMGGTSLWNSGNPVQVSSGGSGYNHKYPIIVNDAHNGVFVTWTRWDSVIDFASQDVIMQHIDSTGNVATGWNPAGTGVAVTSGVPEYYPQLTLTPDHSSVFVIYADGYIGATSLLLNKFNASNGTLASGWTTGGITLSSGPDVYPEINHDLWVYSDNSNNAVVFWIESRVSANGECYVQQINPAGAKLLTANGVLIAGNNANGIDYLEVKQEADKNFLVAYNNLNTFNDVATMKVKPNASIVWNDTANTHGGYSAYPYPASDGNGGMYVFYANTNTPEKLYALGLDSTGALYAMWALPGVGFGDLSDYDGFNPNYDQNAIGTVKGVAVVAWNRVSSGFYNIFTCNIHPDKSSCSSATTGMEEVSNLTNGYEIYPNPSSNTITVSGNYNGQKQIIVYNVLGQTLYTTYSNEKRSVLNISGFNAGVYFVNIMEQNSGKRYVYKLIKN